MSNSVSKPFDIHLCAVRSGPLLRNKGVCGDPVPQGDGGGPEHGLNVYGFKGLGV